MFDVDHNLPFLLCLDGDAGPIESRPDLDTYLSPEEFGKYKSMIGPDDWCVNFDQEKRMCTIYEDRPGFCRVDAEKYKVMYDVEGEQQIL